MTIPGPDTLSVMNLASHKGSTKKKKNCILHQFSDCKFNLVLGGLSEHPGLSYADSALNDLSDISEILGKMFLLSMNHT